MTRDQAVKLFNRLADREKKIIMTAIARGTCSENAELLAEVQRIWQEKPSLWEFIFPNTASN